MMHERVTRRAFLRRSAGIAAGVALPWVVSPRLLRGGAAAAAPSERITLGVIGIGPRCHHVLGAMLEQPDMQCVAICDVQASRRQSGKAMVDARYGNKDCVLYRDLRELLARKDIDAVLIATGDRWHAPASTLAAKAGKDIYSEKPCALTLAQCKDLADTMHLYGRVFQAGTQRRSIGNFRLAVHLARSGKLGKLHTLHASVYRPRVDYGWLPGQDQPPPETVDWDMWLGVAPWRPYNSRYVQGGWRAYYDFDSGATLLDWAAHTVDLCQWANGSDGTTPIEYEPTQSDITARYANGVKLVMDFLDTPFGNRDPQYRTQLGTCPVRFEGSEGWVETGDAGGIEVHPASLQRELRRFWQGTRGRLIGTDAGGHGRNFLDCVKSRAPTAANPDIMRHSHVACHAAAIAWLLGRKLSFDPVREEFADGEANRLRSRASRLGWLA